MAGWNGKLFLEFVHTGDIAVDASSNCWLDGGPGVGPYNYSKSWERERERERERVSH